MEMGNTKRCLPSGLGVVLLLFAATTAATTAQEIEDIPFTMNDLMKAIPEECFEKSLAWSTFYCLRDFAIVALLYHFQPNFFEFGLAGIAPVPATNTAPISPRLRSNRRLPGTRVSRRAPPPLLLLFFAFVPPPPVEALTNIGGPTQGRLGGRMPVCSPLLLG